MKIITKVILSLFLLIILTTGYLYFSFKSSSPRDLRITYGQEDLKAGREKSQIVYEDLDDNSNPNAIWQTSGKRDVDVVFSSEEITAIMNNKPGIYYPYKNIQVKFNSDGTGEISGNLIKSRIPTYATTFNAPQQAIDLVMKFLPDNPSFYLKGKATLVDNKVGVFEPIRFEIGRIPLPLDTILADMGIVKTSYAIDVAGLIGEVSKVDGKKGLIIDFINSRLSAIEGFYAEDAHFEENQLIYKGTLPEKESTLK